MSFISISFLCLYFIVFLARLTIGRKSNENSYLLVLLLASLVFYSWHIPAYLFILIFSSIIDYCVSNLIAKSKDSIRRRILLSLSLVANLSILVFLKYLNFIFKSINSYCDLFAIEPISSGFFAQIILPLGISFYTFQSMSYSIDVYRGTIKPHKTFWQFLLFVSFFPQLVAGPIVRAKDFLYQINRIRKIHLVYFYEGTRLIIRGLFLKIVIANNVAPVVDRNWSYISVSGASTILTISVILLFSIQIYGDFCGYSNIARGLGYHLGFKLPKNFNTPYISLSPVDFWERWHISLSKWFQDYLYFPLAMHYLRKTKGFFNKYKAHFISMTLIGFWHGANWTFLLFGVYWALVIIIYNIIQSHFANQQNIKQFSLGSFYKSGNFLAKLLKILMMLFIIGFGWVFFRSETVFQATSIIKNVFWGDWSLNSLAGKAAPLKYLIFAIPVVLIHLFALTEGYLSKSKFLSHKKTIVLNQCKDAISSGVMLFLIFAMYGEEAVGFIYFQF